MEECTHKIGWFSTRFTYPPIIGKMSTCWRCGHTKAGSNTVTFAANHIDMTHASAPSDPSSGAVRVFSTGTTNLTISNVDTDDHTFGGGGSAVLTVEGSADTSDETSTTSASAADLTSISGLNIAATKPIVIQHLARGVKGGSSANQDVGLELNGTLVMSLKRMSYGTSNHSGLIYYYVGQRQTNYVRAIGGMLLIQGYNNYGGAADNDITTDAITSVTISGLTSAGTLHSSNLFVHTLATS